MQQSLISPRGSWAGSNNPAFGHSPINSNRQSMPAMPAIKTLRAQSSTDLRSLTSIETELKFVHKVNLCLSFDSLSIGRS